MSVLADNKGWTIRIVSEVEIQYRDSTSIFSTAACTFTCALVCRSNQHCIPSRNSTLTCWQDVQCVEEVRELLLDRCEKNATPSVTEQLEKILGDTSKPVGLLLSERFVNVPPQIALPLHKHLQWVPILFCAENGVTTQWHRWGGVCFSHSAECLPNMDRCLVEFHKSRKGASIQLISRLKKEQDDVQVKMTKITKTQQTALWEWEKRKWVQHRFKISLSHVYCKEFYKLKTLGLLTLIILRLV